MKKITKILFVSMIFLFLSDAQAMWEEKIEENIDVKKYTFQQNKEKDEEALSCHFQKIDIEKNSVSSYLPHLQNPLHTEQTFVEDVFPMNLTGKDPSKILPPEILTNVLIFLDINDLGTLSQTSSQWKKILETTEVWKIIGIKKYGNYLNREDLEENPKQKAIQHYLSVLVNTKKNLETIEQLVRNYTLNLYTPSFKKHINPEILTSFIMSYKKIEYPCAYEELIAQGSKETLVLKYRLELEKSNYISHYRVASLIYRKFKNPVFPNSEARAFCKTNEILVNMEDPEAIRRKIWGLTKGDCVVVPQQSMHVEFYNSFGYARNPSEAKAFIEELATKGNLIGIEKKIEGLAYGWYNYEKNLEAAREFNELLIERGEKDALRRKIEGLWQGKYGYDENIMRAREFNEFLVERGDQEAITRKIEGFALGWYGYEMNPAIAIELNERFIVKEELNAIERKIKGLMEGRYGYQRNTKAAKELIEELAKKGNLIGIQKKIEGYTRDLYGYNINPALMKIFIKEMRMSDTPFVRGIGHYLKAFALKHGISALGYQKNYNKGIAYVQQFSVPF